MDIIIGFQITSFVPISAFWLGRLRTRVRGLFSSDSSVCFNCGHVKLAHDSSGCQRLGCRCTVKLSELNWGKK